MLTCLLCLYDQFEKQRSAIASAIFCAFHVALGHTVVLLVTLGFYRHVDLGVLIATYKLLLQIFSPENPLCYCSCGLYSYALPSLHYVLRPNPKMSKVQSLKLLPMFVVEPAEVRCLLFPCLQKFLQFCVEN